MVREKILRGSGFKTKFLVKCYLHNILSVPLGYAGKLSGNIELKTNFLTTDSYVNTFLRGEFKLVGISLQRVEDDRSRLTHHCIVPRMDSEHYINQCIYYINIILSSFCSFAVSLTVIIDSKRKIKRQRSIF